MAEAVAELADRIIRRIGGHAPVRRSDEHALTASAAAEGAEAIAHPVLPTLLLPPVPLLLLPPRLFLLLAAALLPLALLLQPLLADGALLPLAAAAPAPCAPVTQASAAVRATAGSGLRLSKRCTPRVSSASTHWRASLRELAESTQRSGVSPLLLSRTSSRMHTKSRRIWYRFELIQVLDRGISGGDTLSSWPGTWYSSCDGRSTKYLHRS